MNKNNAVLVIVFLVLVMALAGVIVYLTFNTNTPTTTNQFPNAGPFLSGGTFKVTDGNSVIVLQWTAPTAINSTITAYQVFRGTASGQETPFATLLPDQIQLVDRNLQPGNTYYYYVTAILSNGITGMFGSEIMAQQ